MNNYTEYKSFNFELRKEVTVRIYDKAKIAIDKNWNSLYFPDKEDNVFASARVGDIKVSLYVCGDVLIALPDGKMLKDYEDGATIRNLVENDALVDCKVMRRNWFNIDDGSLGGCTMEEKPTSINELGELMLWYAVERFEEMGRKSVLVPMVIEDGKKSMQKFVIRPNNMGNKQTCPICGDIHKPSIAKTVFIVGEINPICRECQETYVPAMMDKLAGYYGKVHF